MEGLLIALSVFALGLMAGQELLARHRRRVPRRALERAQPAAIASLRQGELTKITGVVALREAMTPTFQERSRYREILLEPGDRVSVLGRATMAIDPAGRSSFREPPMLHHISGSDDAPVIVAHDNMKLG